MMVLKLVKQPSLFVYAFADHFSGPGKVVGLLCACVFCPDNNF